jgi:hypothetical protein
VSRDQLIFADSSSDDLCHCGVTNWANDRNNIIVWNFTHVGFLAVAAPLLVVSPIDKAVLNEITTLDLALTELLSIGKPDTLGSCTRARWRRSSTRRDSQCNTNDQGRSQLN